MPQVQEMAGCQNWSKCQLYGIEAKFYVYAGYHRAQVAEEQIRASLKEKNAPEKIHHRVKNNMQIVSSLLDHQYQFIKDKNVIEIFTESQTG